MKVFYETKAFTNGGRNGRVASEDGALDLQLSMPKAMGGPGGEGTNPEQLFAAGYAACFDSALNHVARLQKVNLEKTAVTSKVGIGQLPGGSFGLTVDIAVEIVGVSRDQAEELLHAADAVCPYSNALRNNVDVQLTLI